MNISDMDFHRENNILLSHCLPVRPLMMMMVVVVMMLTVVECKYAVVNVA
jgi:hypothetical protein